MAMTAAPTSAMLAPLTWRITPGGRRGRCHAGASKTHAVRCNDGSSFGCHSRASYPASAAAASPGERSVEQQFFGLTGVAGQRQRHRQILAHPRRRVGLRGGAAQHRHRPARLAAERQRQGQIDRRRHGCSGRAQATWRRRLRRVVRPCRSSATPRSFSAVRSSGLRCQQFVKMLLGVRRHCRATAPAGQDRAAPPAPPDRSPARADRLPSPHRAGSTAPARSPWRSSAPTSRGSDCRIARVTFSAVCGMPPSSAASAMFTCGTPFWPIPFLSRTTCQRAPVTGEKSAQRPASS